MVETYPIPIRSMGGDGDVSGSTIDGVTVDVEGVVPHLEYNTYVCFSVDSSSASKGSK